MRRFVVKITKSIGLIIYTKGRLIHRCVLTKTLGGKYSESMLSKFKPYLEGGGDPQINFKEIDLSSYRSDVIEVYRVLREKVKPGETITYSELGKLVGKHPRFVGYCMRINRFPLLIPCHRVVSKKGLGGFSYGAGVKEELLRFEKSVFG